MSLSPDYSALPTNNWATSNQPDYTFQPTPSQADAYSLPVAPLMQQPQQDVYGNGLAPSGSINQLSTDTYTPSFAKSSDAEALGTLEEPIPFTGKHPLPTALATVGGAIAGGVAGGVIRHVSLPNEKEETDATKTPTTPTPEADKGKPATTTTEPAKVTQAGWALKNPTTDVENPTVVNDTTNSREYKVTGTTVESYQLDGSGKKTKIEPPSTVTAPNAGFTVNTDGSKSKTVKGVHNTYIDHGSGILELNTSRKRVPIASEKAPLNIEKKRYLIDTANNVVLELKDKKIVQIFDVSAGVEEQLLSRMGARLKSSSSIPKQQTVTGKLTPFKTVLDGVDTDVYDKFVGLFKEDTPWFNRNWTNPMPAAAQTLKRQSAAKPQYVTGSDFKALKKAEQELLMQLVNTNFNTLSVSTTPVTPNGHIADLATLKTACGFEPSKVITQAAEAAKDLAEKAGKEVEKDAKELDWGKYALPVGIGTMAGAGALFGLDYWLQRRKSKEVVETEPA